MITGSHLYAVITALNAQGAERSYESYPFTELPDQTLATDEMADALNLTMEGSVFDSNYELSAHIAHTEGSIDGVGGASATVGSTYSVNQVSDNGMTIGAGQEMVSVSAYAGDTDRSYAGLSLSAGTGAYADAAFGRNDQYGFTLDLPVFPIGIALYVKGSDVVWLANETVDLANGTAAAAESLWNTSIDALSNASDVAIVNITDVSADAVTSVQVGADRAFLVARSTSQSVVSALDTAGDTVVTAMNTVGDAIADGLDTAIDEIESALSTASDAGSAAIDWVIGLF